MTGAIRERLFEVARTGETITYGELGQAVGVTGPRIGHRLRPYLDAIDRAEHARGRPLLCSLVVRRDSGRAGRGFFTLAALLGVYDGSDEEAFWAHERDRTHAFYGDPPNEEESSDS